MDAEYKSKIKNSNMKKRLLALDNIPVIEDLLDRESQQLDQLQIDKEGEKLDFGKKVSAKELKNLFPQICTEVDEFLGIQKGKVPKFGYFNLMKPEAIPVLSIYTISGLGVASALASLFTGQNLNASQLFNNGMNIMYGGAQFIMGAWLHLQFKSSRYNRLTKRVTLEKTVRTDLIPAIGHEYTHRVQHINGVISKKYSIFTEGHARGVQRQLAEDYQEREDNEAFLYEILNSTVGELKSAYLWMCKKLGQKPSKGLLRIGTGRDADENFTRLVTRKPTSHAIGNALFSIYEAKKGKKIYNHMIHGDFQFE